MSCDHKPSTLAVYVRVVECRIALDVCYCNRLRILPAIAIRDASDRINALVSIIMISALVYEHYLLRHKFDFLFHNKAFCLAVIRAELDRPPAMGYAIGVEKKIVRTRLNRSEPDKVQPAKPDILAGISYPASSGYYISSSVLSIRTPDIVF